VVSTSNPLSGKDVKLLIEDVLASYPQVDKKVLKSKLGLHSKALVNKKKVGPNKTTIWEVLRDDGTASPPVLFDASGGHGSKIVPTMFTLWLVPTFCKAIETWPVVSEKIIQGADLMLPGVIVPSSGLDFEQGEIRSVTVQGNPFPFAVGEMACSSEDAQAGALKGKGVIVFHTYLDQLWELGGKSVPDASSFLANRVVAMTEAPQPADSAAKVDNDDDDDDDDNLAAATSAKLKVTPSSPAKGMAATGSSPAPSASWMSDPNELVDRTFLQALGKVSDDDLPLPIDTFFKTIMQPCRPLGALPLDVASTRYKKMGKLFQQMKKKGLVKLEEVADGEAISKVNRNCKELREHERWADENGFDVDASAVTAPEPMPAVDAAKPLKVDVFEAYSMPSSDAIKSVLFGCAPLDVRAKHSGTLVSGPNARATLQAYCKRNDLIGADELVTPDKTLKDALFSNTKKVGESYPERLSLADAWDFLVAHLIKHHVIVRSDGAEPIVKKGAVKPVKITLEERHAGRKHLTHVTNLERFGIDVGEFADLAQKRFSAACSIQPVLGKEAEAAGLMEVLIQGDCLKEVAEWLRQEYGLKKEYVDAKR